METEQSLNQERHPTNQQGDDGQVNERTYLRATGGQANEVSCPIPEAEEIAGYLLNTRERQPVYQRSDVGGSNGVNMLNGGGVISREESSIQEPAACQLVNGQQQQSSYQQSAQANALSHPTQEMGLDTRQSQDRQEVPCPIQETAPFAERTPDEHEGLPPCHQQLNGADINAVSSTGDREQAVEHTCSRQELQLWRQESDRQADVTSTTFLLEIKYRVIYVISCDWRQQSLFF